MESTQNDFWQNTQKAGETMRQMEDLKKEVKEVEKLEKKIEDILDFMKFASGKKDRAEVEKEIKKQEKNFLELERKTFFDQKYDKNDAIISIYSGAGGVDAQDWAEMILRMYLYWAEKNNFKSRLSNETRGQEAGIKNATLEIIGAYAYGSLRSEVGTHRLVRLSPFNADNLRQTSFALVEVMPVISEREEEKINPQDLKVDVFRSQGAGGQSVNTTDSAVRITHIPSGIQVTCQNERSQFQNKEQALKILRSRLHQKRLEEIEKKKREIKGEVSSAEWGSQIRSYVLHPYKMVKDHRTKVETSQTEKVLAGDLGEFIEGYLRSFKK